MKNSFILFSIVLLNVFCINASGQTFYTVGTTTPAGSGSGAGPYDFTPTGGSACHNQSGALWCGTSTIDFTQPFELDFQASFDVTWGEGADGICAVFGQFPDTTHPIGGGGSLGYYDGPLGNIFLSHSFAVEFDIYDNGPTDDDIPQDHIAIAKDGNPNSVATGGGPVPIDPSLTAQPYVKDSTFRDYRIIWSPATQTMLVYCNCHLRLTCHYDYASIFSTPTTVNWGFTASTGGYCSHQIIENINLSIPSVDAVNLSQCGGSITLTAPADTSYYWYPSGKTTDTTIVSTSGTYAVLSYSNSSCTTSTEVYSVTITDTPSIAITYSDTAACINTPFIFTLIGPIGDAVNYTITTPTCSYRATATFFPGATVNVTVPSSCIGSSTGSVCIKLTSVTTVAGPCTFPLDTTMCVPILDPLPGAISSPISSTCMGYPDFTVSDTGSAGATGYAWSVTGGATITPAGSSATIHITGPGLITITCYVLSYCGSIPVYTTVLVNPIPDAGTITGSNPICLGSRNAFSETVAGGAWSSINTTVATIDLAGNVYGAGLGTDTIIYTVTGPSPTYCQSRDSFVVTVITLPAPPTISLFSPVVYENCLDTLTGSPGVGGYITSVRWWFSVPSFLSGSSSSSTLVVTGSPTSVGTTTVYYSDSDICGATPDSISVNVIPRPPITGSHPVCVLSTITLADSLAGGTWSASNTNATVTPGPTDGGIVTGVSGGLDTITYTTYCGSVTAIVTVNPLPDSIRGDSEMCYTFSTTFTDSTSGGVWSSSNTSIVTINPTTGFATGTGVGADTIIYTLLSTGCAQMLRVTVNPLPSVISIPSEFHFSYTLCVGENAPLTDSVSGGFWTSSDSSILTIDTILSGDVIILGVSAGTATITYTLPTGCYVVSSVITVNPLPAPITGTFALCPGGSTILTDDSASGTWSTLSGIVTVDTSTGLVTAISAGTAAITYTLPTGCPVTVIFTVNPLPAPFSASVCVGVPTALSDTGGGTWSSDYTGIATVVTATGVVTGVSPGIDSITYTLPAGCSITSAITVNSLPLPIAGADSVCGGATITLNDATTGGSWNTDIHYIATVGAMSGVVTGGSVQDTVSIFYTLPTGCFATFIVSVNELPVVPSITGVDTVCISESTTLFDAITTGVWSTPSGLATVADVSGDGVVTAGPLPGIAPIYYTLTNACGSTEGQRNVDIEIPDPPIIGSTGVCSGSTDILSDAVTGGVWKSSDTTIAKVSRTGVVTGITSGTATITYSASNACGPFAVTKEVIVNSALFITTSFSSSCQTLATSTAEGGNGNSIITPGQTCVILCDSSVTWYYANGNGDPYNWVVSGGTIIESDEDSIAVFWPAAGTLGNVYLYNTVGHCSAETSICVEVIQRPHAYFSASTYTACLGDNISFTDLSSGDPLSPIIYWSWNFGDSTGSAEENPSHIYTTPGYYLVTLIIKNQCNCSDTVQVGITVLENPGPTIICPSIVCQGDTVTYSTDARCDSFDWSVTGGVIVSGAGTASIQVCWNNPPADGFGSVSLSNPCGLCTYPTTVQIPIIMPNVPIQGPAIVCTGVEVQYSLPLWPATQYRWGVEGDSADVVGFRDDHTVDVNFSTPGTFVIHGWFQNRLKLCGGDVNLVVTVWPSTNIAGPESMCDSTTATYTLADSYISGITWTESNLSGSVLASTTGLSFTNTFNTPGTYIIAATGDFCASPIGIVVETTPPPLDSITGPDTVCMNVPYTYMSYTHSMGFYPNWQIVGGTITPAFGSDSVTIVWTNDSAMQLSVNLINTNAPYCGGPVTTVSIIPEAPNANINGNPNPCANGEETYICGYLRGDVYSWQITPNTAGSIVSNPDSTAITVQWNNYTGSAAITLIVQKCDTTVYGNFPVMLTSPPPVTLSASAAAACPGAGITFTATTGGTTYNWNWGDGTYNSTHTNVSGHGFPLNTTSDSIDYLVTVTVSSTGGACPLWGTASTEIGILPGPTAYLSTGDNTNLCPYTTALLVGTVTDNAGGTLTYVWETSPAAPAGSTNSTYTFNYTATASSGSAYFVVTALDGCSAASNTISLTMTDTCAHAGTISCSGCGSGGGAGVTGCTVPLYATDTCTILTLRAATYSGDTGSWTAEITPSGGPLPAFSPTVTATYPNPGVYRFHYTGTYSGTPYGGTTGCHVTDTVIADTLGLVPYFRWRMQCGAGGLDSVYLQDNSVYLTWWVIDSIVWDTSGVRVDSGANLAASLPAGRSYTVTETLYGTRPVGTGTGPFSCPITQTVTLPGTPDAAFTDSVTPICIKVPITFTPTDTAGLVSYNWSFDDGSSILIPYPEKTYVVPSPPIGFDVILTVTDYIGCVNSYSQNIAIKPNNLSGGLGSDQTVCSKDRPVVLSFISTGTSIPTKYQWSNGDTTATDSIYVSGIYFVKLTDSFKCKQTIPTSPALPVKINIIFTPPAQIYGSKIFCTAQGISLVTVYDSTLSYQWYRDSTLVSTTSAMFDHGLAPGTYYYQLIVNSVDTSGCPDTSAIDTVQVYASPPVPVISGPNIISCPEYLLQLAAVDSSAGYYYWSNGITGPVDIVNSGGPYLVTFTDMNGCTAQSEVYVPMAPSTYAPYFPTGCYTFCSAQLPITLYGPPDVVLNYWAWMLSPNDTLSYGDNSVMAPYNIDSGGLYQWEFSNGLCGMTTDTMSITVAACGGCQQVGLNAKVTCTGEEQPAQYTVHISFTNPGPAGTTYTLGTDIGPVEPFSGTLTSTGSFGLSLTFTTLYTSPTPDSVTIEVLFTMPDGTQCFTSVREPLPPCTWISERQSDGDTLKTATDSSNTKVSTAMLVFPNPTSGNVTVSYNYGSGVYATHSLTVYDEMGRTVQSTMPQDTQGNWTFNTTDWMPGIYIIRMEGNGLPLQLQRLVVVSK